MVSIRVDHFAATGILGYGNEGDARPIAEEIDRKNLNGGQFDLAARLFNQLMTGSDFPEFLTLVAYEHLD